jgi:formylmethanofuran dehydrogenase subunit E
MYAMLAAVLLLPVLDGPGEASHPVGVVPTARAEGSHVIATILDAHGHVGPWAVVGYRMGEHAMMDLQLPRHSKSLFVVHHTPLEFKFTCAADGVMAVTGATPGKMNLRVEESTLADLRTVITDRSTGEVLTFRIRPERAKELAGVTPSQLLEMSRRFAEMSDEEIFTVEETKVAPTLDRSTESILP